MCMCKRKKRGKINMEYYFAWWNVENLFDVENYENRSDKLKRTIKNELKGWSEEVLDKKLTQLADIIHSMNHGKGPDLLGVCEVENDNVLKKLVAKINGSERNYQLAHHDCEDKRGVDVAFIYDGNIFEKGLDFSHVIMKRVATRDIYQVNFKIKKSGKEIIVIGNHWPARSGGVLESEPYRIVAGETLAYWNYRIQQIKGAKIPIIVMGDFNDEPFNRSLVEYALSTSSKKKVLNAQVTTPRLFNLMWEEMGKSVGTHYYQNFPTMLDQILISRGFLVDDADFSVADSAIEIIRYDRMKDGEYGIPKRFGRPSKKQYNEEGYSDHFPIGLKIIEK